MLGPNSRNKLGIEDLLKIAEEDSDQHIDTIELNDDVLTFARSFNLKNGSSLVKKDQLYSLYLKWSNNPANAKKFHIRLGKFFQSTSTYYKINQNFVKIHSKKLLLNKGNKIRNKQQKAHFDLFLKQTEITQGNYWLEDYILYRLYDIWIYDKKIKTRISEIYFQLLCKIYFKKRRTKKGLYYKVSDNIKGHISEESMKNLRSAYEKKNKKIKSKTPSVGP